MKHLHWGIIAPGRIARKFAADLSLASNGSLYAVASRNKDRSEAFAKEFNAVKSYQSYEELCMDPQVDIVYIASPHHLHCEQSLMAIEHGKHVLCEKPLALNSKQARKMQQAAKDKGVFLMEALWSRFLPLQTEIHRQIQSGVFGQARSLSADFFFLTEDLQGRLLNPALGGGALLDIGIYPINISQWFLGKIQVDSSSCRKTEVDIHDQLHCSYETATEYQTQGFLEFGLDSDPFRADMEIGFERGSIKLQSPFFLTSNAAIMHDGKNADIHLPYKGNGYQFQAEHAASCIFQGITDSAIMPLDESVSILTLMDKLRSDWGIHYPDEDL
jgi:predicted dehydrogenase